MVASGTCQSSIQLVDSWLDVWNNGFSDYADPTFVCADDVLATIQHPGGYLRVQFDVPGFVFSVADAATDPTRYTAGEPLWYQLIVWPPARNAPPVRQYESAAIGARDFAPGLYDAADVWTPGSAITSVWLGSVAPSLLNRDVSPDVNLDPGVAAHCRTGDEIVNHYVDGDYIAWTTRLRHGPFLLGAF